MSMTTLDSNELLHLPESKADFNTDFTLGFQAEITTSGTLLQIQPAASTNQLIFIVTPEGKLRLQSKFEDNILVQESLRGGISQSSPVFIALVRKEQTLSLFVNNRQVATQVVETDTLTNSVSGKTDAKTEFVIQDIKFTQQALSAAQLISLQLSPETLTQALKANKAGRSVEVTIHNNSSFTLVRPEIICGPDTSPFPLEIPGGKTAHVYASLPSFSASTHYSNPHNPDINIEIELEKSVRAYQSHLNAQSSPWLTQGITVETSTDECFAATLRISQNLVITNAEHVLAFTEELSNKIGAEKLLTEMNYQPTTNTAHSTGEQIVKFNQAALIFNRRLQEKPLVIVQCQSADDVSAALKTATKYNLPVSIRSGGHDHEGECSGTNTILIDLMGLNQLSVDSHSGIAKIGPGNRFLTLTTALAEHGVMLPHGTCATVALPGFLMGGGWGPWTRLHGMACEYLVSAQVVLGNGCIVEVSETELPDLLWALKGGGGMSYGIVTEFRVQTFPLPQEMIKFELEWNLFEQGKDKNGLKNLCETYPTLDVLKRWEDIIQSSETSALTGTNLKINGKHGERVPGCDFATVGFNVQTISHNCLMYGYWQGDEAGLKRFVDNEFTQHGLKPERCTIDGIGGLGSNYGDQLMSSWDRESFENVQRIQSGQAPLPFPPDLDQPAPHKITSRLAEHHGQDEGYYAALLQSLTSELILEGNREEGLFNYVTLGAIVGDFYLSQDNQKATNDEKTGSAFPYSDKLYTIQYQTWWNTELEEKEKLQDNTVYTRTNRALDWMEVARDFDIPHTSGAFISFKDDSIPTKTYFAQNYERLIDVKKEYSRDEFNHLRKRKTII